MDQGNTANVNFVADLFNLTFYGGENFEVTYTEADFKALTLKEGLLFPKLKMVGHYKAKGKVLLFEFEGEGKMKGEFGKYIFMDGRVKLHIARVNKLTDIHNMQIS